jgi:8-oxo-dGTP pyrophosphatase MutT (NUDIX family)
VTLDPEALRRRLREPLPGFEAQLRMAPRPRPVWPPDGPPLRDAAALLLLYPADGDWWLPLTVRASTLPHHTGQVSLPGGRLDAGETIEQAALREAHEEVGLPAADVTVLGQLTPLPIPVSGHLLHPVVGLAASRPQFKLAEAEVDRLIEASLSHLHEPATVQWQQRTRPLPPGGMMEVPYFHVDGAQVWGATAMVLAEMLAVLAEVNAATTPL